MNREAVVLGQKVISTYQGELLTIDSWLIKKGYMYHNTNPTKDFIEKIIKRKKFKKYKKSNATFKFFLNLMRECLVS